MIGTIICILLSCQNQNPANDEIITLSASKQQELVTNYVNALDSFAMAMPIIGGDIESTWAADTVHTMANKIREGKQTFLENMADIYLMYDYISYGLSYFSAIIGVSGEKGEIGKYVLWGMLPASDSLHHSFISNDCREVEQFSRFALLSTMNMQVFFTLNAMRNDSTYTGEDFYYCMQCMEIVDSIKNTGKYSDKDLYKITCLLESSAFFKMIVPFMRLLDKPSGHAKKNEPSMIEMAYYFDNKTKPVFESITKGKRVIIPSDRDFDDYILQTTKYKVALLRIATDEMLSYRQE